MSEDYDVSVAARTVGANVAAYRDALGLGQTTFGVQVGRMFGPDRVWSRQAVSAAEKGRRAWTAGELVAVAKVLGVQLEELFARVDFTPSPEPEPEPVLSPAEKLREAVGERDSLATPANRTASNTPVGDGMSRDELLALPAAVDVVTAGRALGISRNKAYTLVRAGEFPVKTLPLGGRRRVLSADLCAYLGVS